MKYNDFTHGPYQVHLFSRKLLSQGQLSQTNSNQLATLERETNNAVYKFLGVSRDQYNNSNLPTSSKDSILNTVKDVNSKFTTNVNEYTQMTTNSPIPENINNIEPVLESGKMVTNIANDLGNYLLQNPSHFEQFLQLQMVDGSSLLQHYVTIYSTVAPVIGM